MKNTTIYLDRKKYQNNDTKNSRNHRGISIKISRKYIWSRSQWSRNSKSVHFYKKHHIHESTWIIHEKKDEVLNYIASYSVLLDSS
jgi:hypothetical protein